MAAVVWGRVSGWEGAFADTCCTCEGDSLHLLALQQPLQHSPKLQTGVIALNSG